MRRGTQGVKCEELCDWRSGCKGWLRSVQLREPRDQERYHGQCTRVVGEYMDMQSGACTCIKGKVALDHEIVVYATLEQKSGTSGQVR